MRPSTAALSSLMACSVSWRGRTGGGDATTVPKRSPHQRQPQLYARTQPIILNLYHKLMQLPDRDRSIVRHVALFGQMTASQVHELVFVGVQSRTPIDRALKRLVRDKFLAAVEFRRVIGGARGGAGQYVYQLGRRGYGMYFDGEYHARRVVSYHQLLLVDCYIAFKRLERDGLLTIDVMQTGEDAAVKIGGVSLRPDMRIDMTRVDGARFLVWLEVDMATEGRRQVRDKLGRYWQAVCRADASEWPDMPPRPVFVACDDERAKELRWIIAQGQDAEARAYFKVTSLPELPTLFTA